MVEYLRSGDLAFVPIRLFYMWRTSGREWQLQDAAGIFAGRVSSYDGHVISSTEELPYRGRHITVTPVSSSTRINIRCVLNVLSGIEVDLNILLESSNRNSQLNSLYPNPISLKGQYFRETDHGLSNGSTSSKTKHTSREYS